MTKVVIKILHGSVVTQTVQGGLIIHFLLKFLEYMCAKKLWKSFDVCQNISEDKAGFFWDAV